jgi:hypothetical protein
MLLGWLLLHNRVESADGAIGELVDFGGTLPAATLGAAASFLAYLIGSLSEDAFGRALNLVVRNTARDVASSRRLARRYPSEMSDSFVQAQIGRLENNADRLRAESDLRVALLPPFIALVIYFGITQGLVWFLGLLLAPAFAAQAWIRTRDYLVSSDSLFQLRQRVGIPPGSVREAEARTAPSLGP